MDLSSKSNNSNLDNTNDESNATINQNVSESNSQNDESNEITNQNDNQNDNNNKSTEPTESIEQQSTNLINNNSFLNDKNKWILELDWNFYQELIILLNNFNRALLVNHEIDPNNELVKNKDNIFENLIKITLKLDEVVSPDKLIITNNFKYEIIDQLMKNEYVLVNCKNKINNDDRKNLINENQNLIIKLIKLTNDKLGKNENKRKLEDDSKEMKNDLTKLKKEFLNFKKQIEIERSEFKKLKNIHCLGSNGLQLNAQNNIQFDEIRKNVSELFKNDKVFLLLPITNNTIDIDRTTGALSTTTDTSTESDSSANVFKLPSSNVLNTKSLSDLNSFLNNNNKFTLNNSSKATIGLFPTDGFSFLPTVTTSSSTATNKINGKKINTFLFGSSKTATNKINEKKNNAFLFGSPKVKSNETTKANVFSSTSITTATSSKCILENNLFSFSSSTDKSLNKTKDTKLSPNILSVSDSDAISDTAINSRETKTAIRRLD